MQTFIALLRGINVGKAKRVPMAELRALLIGQGYSDVTTLLNSGNAVFRSAKGAPSTHAKAIACAITARFNFDVHVIVKSAQELAAIVLENPINAEATDHAQLLVAFVQAADELHGLQAVAPLAVPPDEFIVGPHAAYLHCTKGILASSAAKALLGKAGNATTTRNWATVLKLQALAQAIDC